MRALDMSQTDFVGDPRFTGSVAGLHINPDEDAWLHSSVVFFDPCARTAWHSHERGQVLICVAGHGYVGTRNGHVIELRAGRGVWTDAGEDHWHGAGADSAMNHVAVQTETPGVEAVAWHEPVADRDWRAAIA